MTPVLAAALARLAADPLTGKYVSLRNHLIHVMDPEGYWRPVESLLKRNPGMLRDATEHAIEQLGLTWTLGGPTWEGGRWASVSAPDAWVPGRGQIAKTAGEALLLALDNWLCGEDV